MYSRIIGNLFTRHSQQRGLPIRIIGARRPLKGSKFRQLSEIQDEARNIKSRLSLAGSFHYLGTKQSTSPRQSPDATDSKSIMCLYYQINLLIHDQSIRTLLDQIPSMYVVVHLIFHYCSQASNIWQIPSIIPRSEKDAPKYQSLSETRSGGFENQGWDTRSHRWKGQTQ